MTDSVLQRLERRIHPDTRLGLIMLLQLGLPSEIPGYLLGLVRYPPGKFLVALAAGEFPHAVAIIWLGAGRLRAYGDSS